MVSTGTENVSGARTSTTTTQLSVGEFKKILRQNGFIDRDSIVIRRRSYTNWMEFDYEVITRRCVNIGNLIEIERQYGLGLNFVAPHTSGWMKAVFGKVIPRR
jgi:hypothetical protein